MGILRDTMCSVPDHLNKEKGNPHPRAFCCCRNLFSTISISASIPLIFFVWLVPLAPACLYWKVVFESHFPTEKKCVWECRPSSCQHFFFLIKNRGVQRARSYSYLSPSTPLWCVSFIQNSSVKLSQHFFWWDSA